MKKSLCITVALILLAVAGDISAQSTKKIKERGIASKTVMEYFIEEGIKEPVVESIEKYDADGELVELQEFNKAGEVKKWEKYVYDEKGKLIEEIFLDEKGRPERREKNIYKDGLRVEKQYFNSKDKMYKRKVYTYEYR